MCNKDNFKEKTNDFIDGFCIEDVVEQGKKALKSLNKAAEKCIDKIEESGVISKIYDVVEEISETCLSGIESLVNKNERKK